MHFLFVYCKYCFVDTVRELLSRVPANAKSELPASATHTIAPELVGEYDLTPLHLAAYSGSEDVVRVLLNSSGVDVEGGCTPAVTLRLKLILHKDFYRINECHITYNISLHFRDM